MLNKEIKKIYADLNSIFKDNEEIQFMNHGYYPIDNDLFDENIFLKTCATLYLYCFKKIKFDNTKSIVEVGCGRGGGINLLSKKYTINNISGCDISEKNIEYCKSNYKNIKFSVQDACNMSYSNNEFDFILNVESSHCYESLDYFFYECSRILKKNGILIYTDIFTPKKVDSTRFKLKNKFNILNEEDITNNVYLSCKYNLNLLENNFNLKQKNIEAYNYLSKLYEQRMNIYKSRERLFHIFICQNKITWENI